MANTTQRVQFAKGLKSNYFSGTNSTWNAEQFTGVVYFASDSDEIYVDGQAYGIGGTVIQTLKSNNFVSSVSVTKDGETNQQIDIVYYDKDGNKQTDSVKLFKVLGANAVHVAHKQVTTQEEVDGELKDVTSTTSDYEISLKLDGTDILSQSEEGLKATLSLDYSNGTIYLKGNGGTEIDSVSVADLAKDSFLKSGELVTLSDAVTQDGKEIAAGTQVLKFVLNIAGDNPDTEGTTETEYEKTIYIPLNGLVDTYTAGDGISFGSAATGNTGAGVPISIKLADDSHLKVDANGLALDLSSISADDIKVDETNSIADILSALDEKDDEIDSSISNIKSDLEALDASTQAKMEEIDSSISALKELDGTDIDVGSAISDDITSVTSIADALDILNDRIDAIAGTGDGDHNYSNQQISAFIDNLIEATGTISTSGKFTIDAYNSTLAYNQEFDDGEGGTRKAKSISEIIVAEDASLRSLISSLDSEVDGLSDDLDELEAKFAAVDHRVNGVKGTVVKSEATSGSDEEIYTNISINDSDIPTSEDSNVGGVLSTAQNVSQALASIDQTITWQYFE